MFLEKRGLQIREKNFRCRSGEIDLIAQDERYLVFVEVKYRKNGRSGSSFAAVGREKQRIISRVAMFYLAVHGYREFHPCRPEIKYHGKGTSGKHGNCQDRQQNFCPDAF